MGRRAMEGRFRPARTAGGTGGTVKEDDDNEDDEDDDADDAAGAGPGDMVDDRAAAAVAARTALRRGRRATVRDRSRGMGFRFGRGGGFCVAGGRNCDGTGGNPRSQSIFSFFLFLLRARQQRSSWLVRACAYFPQWLLASRY